MIEPYLSDIDINLIEVSWRPPKYEPYIYKLSSVCRTLWNGEQYVIQNESLASNSTSFRLSDLRPGSICSIALIAAYNPASLDQGIRIEAYTFNKSKMISLPKAFSNSAQRNYIYMCVHI